MQKGASALALCGGVMLGNMQILGIGNYIAMVEIPSSRLCTNCVMHYYHNRKDCVISTYMYMYMHMPLYAVI